MKTIQSGEEILACYHSSEEFFYGSRDFRRQELLHGFGFLCHCSECSLEGEALELNERKRADIREKSARIKLLLQKSSVEGAVKLSLNVLELVKELDIRFMFVTELTNAAFVATKAKKLGISVPDANMLRRDALDYAKKFGDLHMNLYNKATCCPKEEFVLEYY